MDLVTLTDHDSIEGAEILRSRADFFLSEEVTCRAPSGTEVHIGVYGMAERHHIELQRRRNDLPRLVRYVNEQRLFAVVNHPFSALTGRRQTEDFAFFSAFPALEVLNAHLSRSHNQCARQLAERNLQLGVGGSDAHTVASAGSGWTEVPGARNREDFLAGLRQGRGRAGGRSGTYAKLTADVFRIALAVMTDEPATIALAPLLALVPVITFANLVRERTFAQRWGRMILDGPERGALRQNYRQSQESVA